MSIRTPQTLGRNVPWTKRATQNSNRNSSNSWTNGLMGGRKLKIRTPQSLPWTTGERQACLEEAANTTKSNYGIRIVLERETSCSGN